MIGCLTDAQKVQGGYAPFRCTGKSATDEPSITNDIQRLSAVFDVVRLVDPTKYAVLDLDADGILHHTGERCAAFWDNDAGCANCISARAFAEHTTLNKLEFTRNEMYFVISKYITINGTPCVLELVSRLNEGRWIDANGSRFLLDRTRGEDMQLFLDPLTNVYSRRYFETYRTHLEGMEGVALMDVNNFKLINDRCGHAAGDAALRDIANAVRSCIRKTDILIRYGGDEFLLLFPRMTEEAFSRQEKADPAGRARNPHVGVCGCPAFGQHRRHLRCTSDHRGYPQGGLSDDIWTRQSKSPESEIPAGETENLSPAGFSFFQAAAAAADRSLRKAASLILCCLRFLDRNDRAVKRIDLGYRARISHSDRIALCGIVQTLRRIGGIVGKFIGGTLSIRYNEHAVLLLIERAGKRVFLLLFAARGRGRRQTMLYRYPYFRRACCRRPKAMQPAEPCMQIPSVFFHVKSLLSKRAGSVLFLSIRRSTSKRFRLLKKFFHGFLGRSAAPDHICSTASSVSSRARSPGGRGREK